MERQEDTRQDNGKDQEQIDARAISMRFVGASFWDGQDDHVRQSKGTPCMRAISGSATRGAGTAAHISGPGDQPVRRQNTIVRSTEAPWWLVPAGQETPAQAACRDALGAALTGLGQFLVERDDEKVEFAVRMGPDGEEPATARQVLFGPDLDWTESMFPPSWKDSLPPRTAGLACASAFGANCLIDSGVDIPTAAVGMGLEAWDRLAPASDVRVPGRFFRFLHVSEGDAASGLDVLLDSFTHSFDAEDDVSLVLVLPEPVAGNVARRLEEDCRNDPDAPDVVVLPREMADARLKAVYRQCQVFVSPHRGNGFFLPLARAFLAGLPVIATDWGATREYCTPNSAWLIDFKYRRSDFPQEHPHSVWAEPKRPMVDRLLRTAYESLAAALREKAIAGRQQLQAQYAWPATARRLMQLAENLRMRQDDKESWPGRVAFLTTWNAQCGIATYASKLAASFLPDNLVVLAPRVESVGKDEPFCRRCWALDKAHSALVPLARELPGMGVGAVLIQFNYGFYNHFELAGFMDKCLAQGLVVVIELHSTLDPQPGTPNHQLADFRDVLLRCHRILVHNLADLERLKALGLRDNTILFPHGIERYQHKEGTASRNRKVRLIASYGFFLPNKGLFELVQAIKLLRDAKQRIHLRMVNSLYPSPISKQEMARTMDYIARHNLESQVTLVTSFLDDHASLRLLSEADLIVNPYQHTNESASGSVRYALSTGKPVAVTPLSIFDDLGDAVFRLPGITPEDLAEGIANTIREIENDTPAAHTVARATSMLIDAHDFAVLGTRLAGMLRALMRQGRANTA